MASTTQENKTNIAVIFEKIKDIISDCDKFVTKIEFNSRMQPIERIVYGVLSAILIIIVGALMALVIKK